MPTGVGGGGGGGGGGGEGGGGVVEEDGALDTNSSHDFLSVPLRGSSKED